MNKKIYIKLALLPVIFLLAAGCSSSQPQAPNNNQTPPTYQANSGTNSKTVPVVEQTPPPVTTPAPTPSPTPTPTPAPTPAPVPAPAGDKTYSMADVQAANNSSKCWTIISGSVYDLTAWIEQHPGGSQAIISICGKDATSSFNDQHGGQPRPANELTGFKIGVLK